MTISNLKKTLLASVLTFASITVVEAAPVTTKSNFPTSVNYLQLDVKTSSPYLAYVKNTTVNLNALGNFGELYTDLLSIKNDGNPPKSRFKESANNTFSLSYFGAGHQDYIGECVSFIKAVTDAKGTASWYGIEKVSPNKHLAAYTPIATLTKIRSDAKRGYNGRDGKSYVALYLKHQDNGILVLDQNFYEDGKLNIHFIPFSGSNQSNAGNYYILQQDWFFFVDYNIYFKSYSCILNYSFFYFYIIFLKNLL